MWIGFWGVPTLVIVFVVSYWILGIANYLNPSVSIDEWSSSMTKEEEGSPLLLILGVVGVLAAVFAALLWWFYPMISAKLQKKKRAKIGSHQTLVKSRTTL